MVIGGGDIVLGGGVKKGWTDRCASEMHRPSVAFIQQAEEEHRVAKSSLTGCCPEATKLC